MTKGNEKKLQKIGCLNQNCVLQINYLNILLKFMVEGESLSAVKLEFLIGMKNEVQNEKR